MRFSNRHGIGWNRQQAVCDSARGDGMGYRGGKSRCVAHLPETRRRCAEAFPESLDKMGGAPETDCCCNNGNRKRPLQENLPGGIQTYRSDEFMRRLSRHCPQPAIQMHSADRQTRCGRRCCETGICDVCFNSRLHAGKKVVIPPASTIMMPRQCGQGSNEMRHDRTHPESIHADTRCHASTTKRKARRRAAPSSRAHARRSDETSLTALQLCTGRHWCYIPR